MNKSNNISETNKCIIYLNLAITNSYIIQDTIGEGNFGKVKSAIHILTGEKVYFSQLE